MNFLLAILAWFIISVILGLAIWLVAAKGILWVLIVWIIGFTAAVGRVCAKSH